MELSLDSVFVLKPISEFLTELKGGAAADRDAKIAEYRTRLEDEMRKIEVFKRELPLCMLILQDAIERLKEEDRIVVVEEFIPMKKKNDENNGVVLEKENSDMKSWMSSVQLWSSSNFDETIDTKSELKWGNEDVDRSVPENSIENLIEVSKKRSWGGAFVPFKGNYVTDDKEVSEVPILSLGTPMCEVNRANNGNFKSSARGGSGLSMVKLQIEAQQMSPIQQQQCFRKQRQCWSPELHRRFVDALQQLGGSQVATPEQIKEIMQVDGLTSDEVKSHLQKYRLHIRKVPGSSATEANGPWMNQDHCGDNSKENSSQSRSPQGPLLAKEGPSTTGGNSSETEEDDQKSLKSDGYSWKAASHNSSGDV